jgi:hypothetical protein
VINNNVNSSLTNNENIIDNNSFNQPQEMKEQNSNHVTSSPASSMPPMTSIVKNALNPPSYLKAQHENSDNEDGWGEDEQVKITPTYGVAPIATTDETDESFSSVNLNNNNNQLNLHVSQNNNNVNNSSIQYVDQSSTNNSYNNYDSNLHYQQKQQEQPNEDNGLVAVALYDYQAADDDEISFDPNDVITHIEQVGFSLKKKKTNL